MPRRPHHLHPHDSRQAPDPKAYKVELHVSRTRLLPPRRIAFDIELVDAELASTKAVGAAFFDRDAQIPGLTLTHDEFLKMFHAGDCGIPRDGLCFGRYLLARILGDREVQVLWRDIQKRRGASRPLRLELALDAADAKQPDDRHAPPLALLADLPFELLADENGFLFRRHDAVIARTLRGLPHKTFELSEDHALLVAWASPKGNEIPEDVLTNHERATREAAKKLAFRVREPCRHATRQALEKRLAEDGTTEVVSLIAHGRVDGGSVLLHRHGDSQWPQDSGEPVRAEDLAIALRRGQTQVAFPLDEGEMKQATFRARSRNRLLFIRHHPHPPSSTHQGVLSSVPL